MVEIEVDGHIEAASVASAPVEEVEEMLYQHIGTNLSKQLMAHISDMSFIDMELNDETGQFHYKAELVLCSKSDIITNIQKQAVLMQSFGLSEEQTQAVLEITTDDNKGF